MLSGGTPEGMTAADVELRSQMAQALGKEMYPVTGRAALGRAQENHAPEEVLSLLRRLDANRTFDNVQEMWASLGGGTESARS